MGKRKQSILFFLVIFNTWLYMKRVLYWLFHKDVFYPLKCHILTAMNSSLCSTSSDSVKISSVYKGLTFKQVLASIAYFKSRWLNSSQWIFITYYHKCNSYFINHPIILHSVCIRVSDRSWSVLTATSSFNHRPERSRFAFPGCFPFSSEVVVHKSKSAKFRALCFFYFLHKAC